jgi:alkylhydroperoxidase family enzyme
MDSGLPEAPYDLLTRMIAMSPIDLGPVNALVRRVCADVTSLPALPSESAGSDSAESCHAAVRDFAEQFAADVSSMSDAQRGAFLAATGKDAFTVAVCVFIADFVPRVSAGLAALGLPAVPEPVGWDHEVEPIDLVLNRFAPTVGAMRALDPVTTEVVRLRGAVQHACRLCTSLREGAALDAGGSESMYDDIGSYETSELLDERHRAALRFVDALIWTPSRIEPDVAAGVHEHFSAAEALELTLDVMRNAANKIAVALAADAPRVAEGTERYLLGSDGQPVYA